MLFKTKLRHRIIAFSIVFFFLVIGGLLHSKDSKGFLGVSSKVDQNRMSPRLVTLCHSLLQLKQPGYPNMALALADRRRCSIHERCELLFPCCARPWLPRSHINSAQKERRVYYFDSIDTELETDILLTLH